MDDSARRARSVAVTSATPPVAEWITITTPPLRGAPTSRFALGTTSKAPRRTTAAASSTPLCFATGSGGGSGSRSRTNHQPAGATSIRPRNCNKHWRSTAPPLRAVEHAQPIRTSAAQPARQANACHAGCFRSSQFERATASRPRTRATNPTPSAMPTPPDRYVRARLRCSSRASLPLTPRLARLLQQLECALPLRSGQRQSQLMDSFGLAASWVLLRVQRCPRPYRPEEALSIKKCERASSGR